MLLFFDVQTQSFQTAATEEPRAVVHRAVIILAYNFGSSPSGTHLITYCQSISYIAFRHSTPSDVPIVDYKDSDKDLYNIIITS